MFASSPGAQAPAKRRALRPQADGSIPVPPPASQEPISRPGALGADGQSGPRAHQGGLKQLALRGQPLLPPKPKLNTKPHPTGRPRLQPDMTASTSRAAGTAAHPQTFPSSGHGAGRGWPLSLMRITPSSSSKLDRALTRGHCWARRPASGLGQREGGHTEPWGLRPGGSRRDPGCLQDDCLSGPGLGMQTQGRVWNRASLLDKEVSDLRGKPGIRAEAGKRWGRQEDRGFRPKRQEGHIQMGVTERRGILRRGRS